MRIRLRSLLLATVTAGTMLAALGSAVGPAGAGERIRPHQYFGGAVNHQTSQPYGVTVRMACFGAIRPGQTGHPMGGQTISVFEPNGPGEWGYTGGAHSITAWFGAAPGQPGFTGQKVDFRRYRTKALPTSLELPCQGSGFVYFQASDMAPARDFRVALSYVGQP